LVFKKGGYTPYFKKALSRWDSVAVITAIVIGVGIFRVPAEVAKFLQSPTLMLIAWFLGGMISLLGALCYAELSSSFPKTGGNYVYLRESYGRQAAFLFGWTEVLVIRTGSIAAIAFISAEYLRSLLSIDIFFIKPLAIFIVLALSFINIFGLSCGKKIHNLLTVINISALVSIILFGVISQKGNISHFHPAAFALDKNILSDTVKIPLLLSLTNSIFVTGAGVNDDQSGVKRTAGNSIVNAYKLLEDQIADIAITDTNLLAAEGDRFLALNQLPLYQITAYLLLTCLQDQLNKISRCRFLFY